MSSYLQVEAMGLTNEQVEAWSEDHGLKCEDKEDYLANARAMVAHDHTTCADCNETLSNNAQ